MAMLVNGPDLKVVADDVLASLGSHRQIPTFSLRAAGLTVDQAYKVELCCNGKLSKRGDGSLVLDSPPLALRHLVELLAEDSHNPPLQVGEIISTGTLTMPMPVRAGETWTTIRHPPRRTHAPV